MRQGSLFALALGLTLLAAPGAQARVYDDPCPRQSPSEINRPNGTILMCDDVHRIYGQETMRLNRALRECPRGSYKLAGTDSGYKDPLTAHWDYVTRDAWVSWTGGGTLYGTGAYALTYQPLVRNWWLGEGDQPVRYIQSCDRQPQTRGFLDPQDNGVAETGDAGPDDLDGTPEDDAFAGHGGDDELAGGAGDDEQFAGSGDDESSGGAGDDEILTGKGDDSAQGGSGSDNLFDDEGGDDLRGGAGADRFSAHDGTRDRIDCGPGEDVVVGDERDRIADDCEHVYTSRRDAPNNPPG